MTDIGRMEGGIRQTHEAVLTMAHMRCQVDTVTWVIWSLKVIVTGTMRVVSPVCTRVKYCECCQKLYSCVSFFTATASEVSDFSTSPKHALTPQGNLLLCDQHCVEDNPYAEWSSTRLLHSYGAKRSIFHSSPSFLKLILSCSRDGLPCQNSMAFGRIR